MAKQEKVAFHPLPIDGISKLPARAPWPGCNGCFARPMSGEVVELFEFRSGDGLAHLSNGRQRGEHQGQCESNFWASRHGVLLHNSNSAEMMPLRESVQQWRL